MSFIKHAEPPTPTQLPAEPAKGDGAKLKPKADNTLPEPPILENYPDTGHGLAVVTLIGLLEEPALYRVGAPIPQDIAVGTNIFNLSDRAAGVYNFRHK